MGNRKLQSNSHTWLTRRSTLDTKTGCWNWKKHIGTHGYGSMSRGRLAHRVAYQKYVGPIPRGQHVLHRCDNRRCVKPAHLFIGTQSDNLKDASDKGRLNPKSIANLRGRKSGYVSEKRNLTADQVAEIRRRWAAGETQTSISGSLGVAQQKISNIVKYKSYKEAI